MKQKLLRLSIFWIVPVIIGCGGAALQQERIDVSHVLPNYRSFTPANTTILNTPQPVFRFERDTDNHSAANPCVVSAQTATHPVKWKLARVDMQSHQMTTVAQHTLQVPDDCRFSYSPGISLQENEPYTWYVAEATAQEDNNTKWQNIFYSTIAIPAESETDIHACDNNLVRDWTFLEKRTQWQTVSLPTFTAFQMPHINPAGHDDNGSALLQSPLHVIFQTLISPTQQGKYYTLKLSVKHEGKGDFQIKAMAFNGTLHTLTPDTDTALIGLTGNITYHNGDWVKVTFPSWRSNKNFDKLAIVLQESNNTVHAPLIASVDRVCLSEEGFSGCAESVDNASVLPPDFDMNNSDPVETEFEYLAGTVQDLHYDYNTSVASWYEDANNTLLECSTIGGDLTDEEINEIDNELNDPDLDQALMDLNQTRPQVLSVLDNNDSNITSELQPIVFNGNPDKCTKARLDPSKPFMGRDIVYIHGLQLPALKGTLATPPTFQEKWPQDKARFYSGGDIITRARSYWADHISRELGASFDQNTGQYTGSPSNSFMIASWSANQRIDYGIHAVLTQIADAMAGQNPNVVMSDSSRQNNQCFGDNGIVVITHSTGGLLASAMFAIAENSNDPTFTTNDRFGPSYSVKDHFGDIRFISDKFVAQIGFNSAYGGTPFAEMALKVLATLQTANLIDTTALNYYFNTSLPNLSPAQINKLLNSTLVDLHPTVAAVRWRPLMSLTHVPTLMMNSAYLGKGEEGPNIGKGIVKGFDDLVLPTSSQANRYTRRPVFNVKKRRKLKDKGIAKMRWKGQIKDGKKASGAGKRNFFNTPYVAPSGMLQNKSVDYMIDPTNDHIPNHYLILQTTGTHFDNVDKIGNHPKNYERAKTLQVGASANSGNAVYDYANANEETAMVFDSGLYGGWVSSAFANINEEWVRKKTWGFHFFKLQWKRLPFPPFFYPKITWHYYEYIKWKRTYHLMHDYKNKKGADYMYQYLLRP